MMYVDVVQEIKELVKKAAQSDKAENAMKWSQAACNAANAMACVNTIDKK